MYSSRYKVEGRGHVYESILSANPLGDPYSKVELIDLMGTDLTVVNAARVSYAKRSEQLTDRDKRLVDRCMRLDHSSPFEHIVFQFRVRAPLHVVHQWQRHRTQSYNEESGRWVELRGDFFTPESEYAHVYQMHYEQSYQTYKWLLDHGESKENARLVLPLSLYKEFVVTVNGWNLLRFLRLRTDPEAQEHIRAYAQAMEDMIAEVFPTVYRTYIKYQGKHREVQTQES